MSDPPNYIPVGELDTENSVLVDRGYSRESVHMHALAWNFLSTAIKSKSEKSILQRCTSPRQAWDALLAWYGPQTTGGKSKFSRRLDSFKIAPGSNPIEEMGRIEDLAAEIRTAGLTLDDHMLYTIFIALPNTRWRQGTFHVVTVSAVMTSSRLFESGTTDFLETGREGPTLAMLAKLCTLVAAAAAGDEEKVKTAAKEKAESRGSTEKAPWMPAAMAAAPKLPKVVPPR